MRRIEVPDFIVIAERVLDVSSAALLNGYCRLDLADAALAVPFTGFGEYERYPRAHEKAAAYCAAIVRHHPLVDGNKPAATSRCASSSR